MYEQLALYRPPEVKDPTKLEYIACKDYLNNKCTHGEDCKYAHVVNSATLPKGALYQCLTRCGDFHNNNCNRENCKYAHIINAKQLEERHKRLLSMSMSGSASRSRYCQDFRKGKCNRGASCKYLHAEELCRDFNRGECRLAPEQCRYVHKLYSEVDQVDPLKQKRARNTSNTDDQQTQSTQTQQTTDINANAGGEGETAETAEPAEPAESAEPAQEAEQALTDQSSNCEATTSATSDATEVTPTSLNDGVV
eukprot:TRINITY_DN12945_c0_g1_i1.p1 TRINITY_DN12945_c0_g1~~TRINITY_DN12945_c0_g1_i1.p1  ORF type:complete len:290 (-),score=33.04 TRINITY_DN12945_c0_g1_i1:265-1020(-)